MVMGKETEAGIAQLQMIEQNMQQISMQKQQFNMQLLEVESALKELKETDKCYKIIGSLMIAGNKDEILKELSEKKEMLEIRVKSVEKQEASITSKATELRAKILKEMSENEQAK
jgi:prefoldin beta subunit